VSGGGDGGARAVPGGDGLALALTAYKRFGEAVALDGARVAVASGSVHALCGENGAGKSTLMRIAYGLLPADRGELTIGRTSASLRDAARSGEAGPLDGPRPLARHDVAAAQAAGIGMVHQHGMLVPTLTLAENAALGHETARRGLLDLDRARAAVREAGARLGLELPVDAPAGDLTVGEQQRAEIALVAARSPRLLILDEPTALLAPVEVHRLLELLRAIARQGGAVVLVTHKLDEVVAVADAITVLRAGKTVAELPRGTSAEVIARAMVGELPPPPRRARTSGPRPAAGEPRLRVRGLVAPGPAGGGVQRVDLDVGPGEVVGLAGVEGNGQRELALALAGLAPPVAGAIELDGVDVARATVAARRARGLAYIPEDRHRHGLVLDASLADNVALARLPELRRWGLVDRRAQGALTARLLDALDVRPANPALPARALSGGNQQKLVVARELDRAGVRLVLAAQPTRGVDLAAVARIHARLLAAADAGAGVLVISADLDELLALADRIVVMHRGHLAGELAGAALDATDVRVRLGGWMVGAAATEGA
jgi:simple sugar transport system ATP-binding protein